MDYERKKESVIKVLEKPNLSPWASKYWSNVYVGLIKAEGNAVTQVPTRIH